MPTTGLRNGAKSTDFTRNGKFGKYYISFGYVMRSFHKDLPHRPSEYVKAAGFSEFYFSAASRKHCKAFVNWAFERMNTDLRIMIPY